MIAYIVLWRLKATDTETLVRIKRALEAQNRRNLGLVRMEAGADLSGSRRGVDFALYYELESRVKLQAYHKHPVHAEARAIVDPLALEHWIVEFES
jgi:hypothetical protein